MLDKLMELQSMKHKVEEYYGIDDLNTKCRKKQYVDAKRMITWWARENGYRAYEVNGICGVKHDVQVHYLSQSRAWIKNNDSLFISEIFNVFGIEFNTTAKVRRERLERFAQLIVELPEDRVDETYNKIELMIKAYKALDKKTDEKIKIIDCSESISDFVF